MSFSLLFCNKKIIVIIINNSQLYRLNVNTNTLFFLRSAVYPLYLKLSIPLFH